MGELILHTGMPKTGTSSLQSFFFENRTALAAHGAAFPIFTRQPEAEQTRNGYPLNRYCQNLAKGIDPNFQVEHLEDSLEKLWSLISSYERVLLTDENISLVSSPLRRGAQSGAPYWVTMTRILDKVGVEGLTVVVYLRRQDDWAASQWRQSVRTGVQDKSFPAFCGCQWARCMMDYANAIEATERAFDGAARVVVRRYDRASFEGGSIYRDFCAATGIPWDDAYRIPRSESNTSLSFDVAEALLPFKGEAPAKTTLRRDVLIPLALRLSEEYPDARGTTPFDEAAARKLMEPYLEGNELISDRYLDGEPLFSDEYGGRPVWVPNEMRIAEYRTAFEEAIRQYGAASNGKSLIRVLAQRLPKCAKNPLRAVRERLPF